MSRKVIGLAALAVITCGAAPLSSAQEAYPTRPIRFVIGYAAGGATDILARTLAQRLEARLGQPIIVENRPGAEGSLADRAVAKSTPDGYTLTLQGNAVAINVTLLPNIGFDPVTELAPITLIGESPYLLASHASVPAKTLGEFVQYAKARKGQFNYGTPSSPALLAATLLNSMAGIEMTRVPFRGSAPAIPALLSGDVQFMISSITSLLPLVSSDRIRVLAVTGTKRAVLAPDIPTVTESAVPGYSATTWYGLFAPGGTPRAIVDRLNAEMHQVLAEPAVKSKLLEQGFETTPTTPDEFSALLKTEIVKWADVVKASGLQASSN
jgi:tripartite-type tricarboxylate transporter receptor subunit TctC